MANYISADKITPELFLDSIEETIQHIVNTSEDFDWFSMIAKSLRDYPGGSIWADDSYEILCKTESAANTIADMIEQLYKASGEEVLLNTGYYDPEEDKRNCEEDKHTGWWYVDIA